MAIPDASTPRSAGRRWVRTGPFSTRRIRALFLTKAADASTTAIGLLFLSLTEGNPVIRRLVHGIGVVPGVVVASVLGIGVVVGVTELGVWAIAYAMVDRRWVRLVRTLGYGIPSTLWAVVSVHNAALIVATVV